MESTKRIPILQERLRTLQGDLSNVDFAEKLGLSRQAIGFYLNGKRVPDARIILQICERCEVSADYLLGQTAVRDYDIEAKAVEKYTGLCGDTIRLLHTWVKVEEALKKRTMEELDCFSDDFMSMSDEEAMIWNGILSMGDQGLRADVFLTFLNTVTQMMIYRSKDLLRYYKSIVIAYQQMSANKGVLQTGDNLIGMDNYQKLQRNGFQIVDAELAYDHAWRKLLYIVKEEILESIASDIENDKLPWKIIMDPVDNDEMAKLMVEVISQVAEEMREKNIVI